jgi:hypothetical protein
LPFFVSIFVVCNFRYFPWVASISLLRYVCNFLCPIAWFLHHQNGGLKNESAGLRFWCQSICSWILGKHSTGQLPFFVSIFVVCNFRYFPWVASISLLRYVCNLLHHIAWFLHHQNGGLKNESAGLRFWYQSICSWIWVDHSTSKLPFLFLCFGCTTSDIFHGWPPYHYWDMYVIFVSNFPLQWAFSDSKIHELWSQ